jgi:hypothetical protein
MPDRRQWLAGAAVLAAAPWTLIGCTRAGEQKMTEIKFDLGKNIVETARASGVPEFAARDIQGLVSYSIAAIPREIQVRFTRPGLEIAWQPVFGLSMYADRARSLITESVDMSLHIDGMSDEQAQAFAEATIAQFKKGKWKRWADPEFDAVLTGRSSVLSESGEVKYSATGSPDPNYKLTASEWLSLSNSLSYRWVGDGVWATLSINNSPGVDGKPAYRMGLEFELLEVKLKREAENLAQRLKEGDAKGWGSTAEYEADKIKRAAEIKRLIANAVKRGDSVERGTP